MRVVIQNYRSYEERDFTGIKYPFYYRVEKQIYSNMIENVLSPIESLTKEKTYH